MQESRIVASRFVPFPSVVQGQWAAAFSFEDKLFCVLAIEGPSGAFGNLALSGKAIWDGFRAAYTRGEGLPVDVLQQAVTAAGDAAKGQQLSAGAWHLVAVGVGGEALSLVRIGGGALSVLRGGSFLPLRGLPSQGPSSGSGLGESATWVKTLPIESGDRLILLTSPLARVLPPSSFLEGLPWEELGWKEKSVVLGGAGLVVDVTQKEPTASLGGVPALLRRLAPRRRPVYVSQAASPHSTSSKKRLSVAISLLGMALLGSIAFTLLGERRRVRSEKANDLLAGVVEGTEAARNLLGLDSAGAWERIDQARSGLESARVLGASLGQIQSLEKEITEIEQCILKINPVSSQLFRDLGQRAPGMVAQGLAVGESGLLVLDGGRGQVLEAGFAEGSGVRSLREGLLAPRGLGVCEDQVFVWGENGVLVFEPTGGPLRRVPYDAALSIVDASCFGNNLYLLSAAQSQLFKVSLVGSGEPVLRPWLKGEIALDEKSRMAIDGYIYLWSSLPVASGGGQLGVLRCFSRGRETDFAFQEQLGDPIERPTDIVTWRKASALYILDGEHSRVLRFAKDGALLGQYVDSKWGEPRALAISQDEKTAYVLSVDGKIWEFDL